MPGLTLESLPDELILAVLGHIDVDDLHTLHSLNRTNWRFHSLTDELLYAKFRGTSPEQFLHAIALPPPHGHSERTRLVKKVVWTQSFWNRASREKGLGAAERQRLVDKLPWLPHGKRITDTGDLYNKFRDFELDGELHWWYLEFFLLFTPKVESLEVHDVWRWDDHVYWFVTLSANASIFSHLKSITLHVPLRLQNIIPVLALPSLRELNLVEVVSMRRQPDRHFEWTEETGSALSQSLTGGSSLEHLTLQQSDTDYDSLSDVLACIRGLKSFTYEWVDNALSDFENSNLIQNLFWNLEPSVLHHVSTLESVRIRSDSRDRITYLWPIPEGLTDRPFGHFATLRTLDIGPCDLQYPPGLDTTTDARLLGNHLPKTLESLRIQWKYTPDLDDRLPGFIEFMQNFGQSAAIVNPALKYVAVMVWPALVGNGPLRNGFAQLKSAFREVGICLDLIYKQRGEVCAST